MRIGFLFNHDQIHQVAHSLPIALALAKGGFDGEILVATTNERIRREVLRLGGGEIGTRITHVSLDLRTRSQILSGVLENLLPSRKLLVYGDNLDFFKSLDVLVVAEKTSLVLKSLYGLKNLKIIHTRHGAGDRAIGFDKASAGFDHVFCSGPKIRERLIAEAGVPAERISMVGYPKFDTVDPSLTMFPVRSRAPIVLYNPHCSAHLSSWFRHGRQVLDFFLDNPNYQLIFAPHVMLFERKFVLTIDKLRIDRPGHIEERYLRAPNIHIDLGSRASTDMSYTMMADLYLGDVSSQIYEFLWRPRPCLFLNSHGADWQQDANYAHWQAGPVIGSPAELASGLKHAMDSHETGYRATQMEMFARSFDLSDRPSSERAAEVLANLAGGSFRAPQRRSSLSA
jgi:CDP-glycerol glycerophosphotransferase (TagB/SpsB family)